VDVDESSMDSTSTWQDEKSRDSLICQNSNSSDFLQPNTGGPANEGSLFVRIALIISLIVIATERGKFLSDPGGLDETVLQYLRKNFTNFFLMKGRMI